MIRLGLTIRFAAATLGMFLPSIPAGAQEPIKIGVVYSLSGTYAALGSSSANAVKLAFEEEGSAVAGRKIQIIVEDDEGKPDVALAKLRKLVERDSVDLLHAITFTNIGLAVRDYVDSKKIPWISLTGSAALTRDKASPYIFRVAPSNSQWAYATAKWLKEKHGWKKVAWVGANYAAPREAFEAVKKMFGDAIAVDVWPPLGTPDFAPFLSKLADVSADGTMVAVWGGDALKFLPQYNDYGLNKKLPLFGMASFTSEENLPGMPKAIEGVLSGFVYCGTLDSPENRKFVESFKAKFKSVPGSYQYLAYVGGKIAIQALKEVGGKIEDKSSFLKAIARSRAKGPMGEVSFDKNQGMILDMYVTKVRNRGGTLENECVDRIPQVQDPYDLK